MTLVPLAAELIRRATQDPGYEITLFDATASGTAARLRDPVESEELPWLSAGEWVWFAEWRLSVGWSVDIVVLDHIDRWTHTAEMRHRLVTLALRAAERDNADRAEGSWLRGYVDRLSDRSRAEQEAFVRTALQEGGTSAIDALSQVLSQRGDLFEYARTVASRADLDEWLPWQPMEGE